MKRILIACVLLTIGASACTTPAPATNWAACPTAAAGQVQVAVVVEGTATPSTSVVCVVVPTGSTSSDALNARAARIGASAPRFDGGFLCAIDGIPVAPSCGDAGPGGYTYWNFWTGDAGWVSSSVGSGDRTVTQGSVDGWVYGTWDFATTFPEAPTHTNSFAALTS